MAELQNANTNFGGVVVAKNNVGADWSVEWLAVSDFPTACKQEKEKGLEPRHVSGRAGWSRVSATLPPSNGHRLSYYAVLLLLFRTRLYAIGTHSSSYDAKRIAYSTVPFIFHL